MVFVPLIEPLNRNGKELLTPPGGEAMAVEALCYGLVVHAFFPVHHNQLRGLAISFVGASILLAHIKAFEPGVLGAHPRRPVCSRGLRRL